MPTQPDQPLVSLSIPSQAQVLQSGGWTLAGGRKNNHKVKQWRKQAKQISKSNKSSLSLKDKYFEGGYHLFGDFTTKMPLTSIEDYIMVGIQTDMSSPTTQALLYR